MSDENPKDNDLDAAPASFERTYAAHKAERDDLRRQLDEAERRIVELERRLETRTRQTQTAYEEQSEAIKDAVRLDMENVALKKKLDEARQAQRSVAVEPGETIGNTTCPCCGADLEVMHGEYPGTIATLGTQKAQSSVVAAVRARQLLYALEHLGEMMQSKGLESAEEWGVVQRCANRLDAALDEAGARVVSVEVRPEVAAFAQAMERKLRKHDKTRGPKGWEHDDPLDLWDRIEEEAGELRHVLRNNACEEEVLDEAVDVANMAMMTADASGALLTLDQPGAVIVAESERDAEALREWQAGETWTGYALKPHQRGGLTRATILDRRHIDVLREAARYDSRSPTKLIIEALDATEAKS